MKNFLKKTWSGVVKLFGILGNDAKNALKSFWEKHSAPFVGCAIVLFVAIPWLLSVCGVHITSIAGNTVLFVLMLLVASLIGLFEVNCEDSFVATGTWWLYFFELAILSTFVSLSSMYMLWNIAVLVIDVTVILYYFWRGFYKAYRYCVSVWKRCWH